MITPQQILQFLYEVQAQHAAQSQATSSPTPETTPVPQQGPDAMALEQLLLAAMGGTGNAGFWGTGGGYVQGSDLVGGSYGLSGGKLFVQR